MPADRPGGFYRAVRFRTRRNGTGCGIRLLTERMAAEVRKGSTERKGDYRPLVFILTDGLPTDKGWEEVAETSAPNGWATSSPAPPGRTPMWRH